MGKDEPHVPTGLDALITEVVGEDVLPLVHVLKKNKNISEFRIAEILKLEINTTRNMLYRLTNKNLVSFTRKKDKKKGWYIYYWTFNDANVKYIVKEQHRARLEKLEERLMLEKSNVFYLCKNKCARLGFEPASSHMFRCPECGELLEQEDNSKRVEILTNSIAELKETIAREEEEAGIRLRRKKTQREKEDSSPKPVAKKKTTAPLVKKKTVAPSKTVKKKAPAKKKK